MGEFLVTGPVPTKRVAGLMDVIDEDEELNYIDDGTPMETSDKERPVPKTDKARVDPATDEGQNSGLKPQDPIDLDSSEAERPIANQSRSSLPTLEDIEKPVVGTTRYDAVLSIKDDNVLQLENTDVLS
jgi:hypothetical protein